MIVALSSRVDEEVKLQCLDKGFDLAFEAPLSTFTAMQIIEAVEEK